MNRSGCLDKAKTRALLFGMVAAMLTIGTTLFAQSAESDFTVEANDDGTVTITRYEGWDSVVNIPATIGGKAVTAIGEEAFAKQENLTGVTIPNSVTSIGRSAFENNKLASVTFGKGLVTIGRSAFYDNNLTSLTLPDTVKSIGNRAFSHNLLAKITIPGVNTRIGEYAFARNKQLTSVTLGSFFIFGSDIYSSGSFTSFIEEDNEDLYARDWQTNNIGERGKNLFWDYVCNDRKAGAYTPDLKYRAPKKDGDFEYVETRYGAALTKYTGTATAVRLPEKVKGVAVKYLHTSIFEGKTVERVLIPDGVTGIGNIVFYNERLTSVAIPDSVTYIGDSAFSGNRLTSVTIPDSVTYIGDNAFSINGLTSVTIGSGVTYIGRYAFSANKLTSVTIPDNVTYIEDYAFSNNDKLTSVTIGNGVTYIGDSAFYNEYGSVTRVTIGSGVTIRDSYALPCRDVYNNNGKKAGVYTEEGSKWTYAER